MALVEDLLGNRVPRSLLRTRIPRMWGSYPLDVLDEYGYPTQRGLAEIRCIGGKQAGSWIVEVFPEVYREMGCRVEEWEVKSKDGVRYRYVKAYGGSSGGVLGAMVRNFWLAVYLAERRGGYCLWVVPEKV